MTWTERFWNRMADGYARRPVADEDSYRKKLAMTQERLRPDMDVLEIACGTGSTAIEHAPHVRHYEGVDVSGRMLEIAGEKAQAAGAANVSFERAAVDELDRPAGHYGAVLAMSILHLVDDRDAVIEQVYRWLAPDGVFASSTICLADGMGWARVLAPLGWVGLLPRLRFFTADALEASLVRAGFEIECRWQPGPRKAVFFIARKPA